MPSRFCFCVVILLPAPAVIDHAYSSASAKKGRICKRKKIDGVEDEDPPKKRGRPTKTVDHAPSCHFKPATNADIAEISVSLSEEAITSPSTSEASLCNQAFPINNDSENVKGISSFDNPSLSNSDNSLSLGSCCSNNYKHLEDKLFKIQENFDELLMKNFALMRRNESLRSLERHNVLTANLRSRFTTYLIRALSNKSGSVKNWSNKSVSLSLSIESVCTRAD